MLRDWLKGTKTVDSVSPRRSFVSVGSVMAFWFLVRSREFQPEALAYARHAGAHRAVFSEVAEFVCIGRNVHGPNVIDFAFSAVADRGRSGQGGCSVGLVQ